MSRKPKRNADGVVPFPSEKQAYNLKTIKAITINQAKTFSEYEKGQHLFLHGCAGTGKSFVSLYLALKDVLISQKYDHILIIRSAVPTRQQGFLPGSLKQKQEVYEAPYEIICNDLLQSHTGYKTLKSRNVLEFTSTSYIRGITIENTIIIVDEASNCSFHELDSLITRLGENSRIIFCGDFKQTDLSSDEEQSGFIKFMDIMKAIKTVSFIEFGIEDIVRSKFVKEYITIKELGGYSIHGTQPGKRPPLRRSYNGIASEQEI